MKNTMIYRFGEVFCPYYCISCGKGGGILCECCKKYILKQENGCCLNCGEELIKGVCKKCRLPFLKQTVVGARTGVLKALINVYKYQAARAASETLAELMAERLGDLRGVKIIPLPTIRKHVRERGFDTMGRLARTLAQKTGAEIVRILVRKNNCVQVGASEEQRKIQAETAYGLRGVINGDSEYLLFDDVWTTGSSMLAACRVLRGGGAKNLRIAVLAKTKSD